MSRTGAAPRAAVPVSNARAEASRRNGAKSRGPKTPEGKARSSRNALKHGLRAHEQVVLPQEDAAEFATFRAALINELAPVGALQNVLAHRVAVGAWRLARADRVEAEVLEFRSYDRAASGLALSGMAMQPARSRRSCATAARPWPSSRARFAPSRRSRPERAQGQPAGTNPAPRSRARKSDRRVPGPRVAERPRRLAPPRPNEPKKARAGNQLDSGKQSIAALPPPRGATDGAPAGRPPGRPYGPPSSSSAPARPAKAERTRETARDR